MANIFPFLSLPADLRRLFYLQSNLYRKMTILSKASYKFGHNPIVHKVLGEEPFSAKEIALAAGGDYAGAGVSRYVFIYNIPKAKLEPGHIFTIAEIQRFHDHCQALICKYRYEAEQIVYDGISDSIRYGSLMDAVKSLYDQGIREVPINLAYRIYSRRSLSLSSTYSIDHTTKYFWDQMNRLTEFVRSNYRISGTGDMVENFMCYHLMDLQRDNSILFLSRIRTQKGFLKHMREMADIILAILPYRVSTDDE